MKKLVFVLITLFCFFLIACNEKQDDEEQGNVGIDDKINLENKSDLEIVNHGQKENIDVETKEDEENVNKIDGLDVELKTSYDNKDSENIESNGELKIIENEISEELELFLKKTYVDIVNSERQSGLICVDDVDIIRYIGEYGVNGNIFVLVIKGVLMHPASIPENKYFIFTMKQDDISRIYYVKKRISELPLVMDLNNNKIYNLFEVCNKGILSIDEMDKIIYNYKIFVGEITYED
ncbi:MAG: hypothetical protein IJS58_01955 [Bacilli bacterium]|nr:hypothetical protein [Bacilli bacterium]